MTAGSVGLHGSAGAEDWAVDCPLVDGLGDGVDELGAGTDGFACGAVRDGCTVNVGLSAEKSAQPASTTTAAVIATARAKRRRTRLGQDRSAGRADGWENIAVHGTGPKGTARWVRPDRTSSGRARSCMQNGMTRVVLVGSPQIADGLADLPDHRVVIMKDETVPEAGRSAAVLVPPFLAGPAATRVLRELPDLQLIQLLSAGAEHWVSLVPDGVTLCTASGAHGGATAEWAVGALLAVLREFPQFAARQAEQRWDQHATDELGGKRVLVLGAGDLGRQVRARLEPFGVTVTMAARHARDGVVAIGDVPSVLGEHDVVIVMVPLTPATTGLVDTDFLAAMPDGAVLVNAARGPVVDTAALIVELSAGRLRAALDVTDPEPLPAGHPLWSAPGVFITPHVAGSVPGSTRRALSVVRAQLERFASGQPLENVVSSAGY